MSKYSAILFDMDGTLLPMDTEQFTRGYFRFLAGKLAPYGIDPEKLVPAIWDGTAAMVRNSSEQTNDRVFWARFEQITGVSEAVIGSVCLDFYANEFHQAQIFTQPNPLAQEAVRIAHEKAPVVALATNPLFPMAGQITRMSWIGLTPADFDLVTSYEQDTRCKPNPEYFITVCSRLGVDPKDCLMIGNDEGEDMYAASLLGMDCYLVTDTMIANEKHPWQGPRGTFAQMVEMLRAL